MQIFIFYFNNNNKKKIENNGKNEYAVLPISSGNNENYSRVMTVAFTRSDALILYTTKK